MSLHWRYKLSSVQHSIITLGDRWVRPRPILLVTVIGPTDTRVREALLDTGSDDTVFPAQLAAEIGVDLSQAPVGNASGVGISAVPLRFAQVAIRLTDGREQQEWSAWVGFTSSRLNRPLLGFAGFLQFFTATFHGDREEVELVVNSLYPGT